MGRFVVIASTTVDVSNKKLNLLAAVLHAAERPLHTSSAEGLMARGTSRRDAEWNQSVVRD
jgi:hypothetical protein